MRRSDTSAAVYGGRTKKAIRGAWIAFYVDLFDIYLPVVVLAPAIGFFVSPDLGAGSRALITGVIFAATLVGRPVGAAIFGHVADRIGRRRATIWSAVGFGAATLLIGLLPGYAQWGAAAVLAFVALRFIDGIFLGGAYTAANPLAMEHSPQNRRGYYSGLISTAFPVAYISISLLTLVLLSVMPSGGTSSSYSTWGWRIPFILGAILAFGLAWYYSRSVSESELFRESAKQSAPLKTVLVGDGASSFWQVLLLMTGLWTLSQSVSAILPGLLQSTRGLGLSGREVTVTLALAFLALIVGYVAAGVLSQRYGRRPFLIVSGIVTLTLGTLAYLLLLTYGGSALLAVACLAGLTIFLVASSFGVAIAYIAERFYTGVRATGFGLSYSLAIVVPSFYAFYQAALANIMPFQYTVLVLVVIGGALVSIGAAWGPETRDVELGKVSETES